MAVAPDVHLFGKLNNVNSQTIGVSTQELGFVEIALCGYGAQIPRVPSEAVFARVTSDWPVNKNVPDNGTFTAYLFSNPLIEPQGTYYTVTIKDSNGDTVQVNAYQFPTAGDFDLDTLIPYDPGQPPPPLPPLVIPQLQIVAPSANPVFDGTKFTAFQITLTGDAQAVIQNMIPGTLYTFIIMQDGAGNHRLGFPSSTRNTAPLNIQPNSTTTQTFVAIDGNVLYAIGGGTWE